MDPLSIIGIALAVGTGIPAARRIFADLIAARRLETKAAAKVRVTNADGTEVSGTLDQRGDVEQLLEALPEARELSVH